MATKRSADDLDIATSRPRREAPKRVRLSPSADARSNSSDRSSCSVSEDSALQSSPPVSTHDRISSMSSLDPDNSASDTESSVSSDTDSDISNSDSEQDDEDIVTIGGPKKPEIGRVDGYDDLKARLATFLPQLEEANGLLTSEGGQWSMEDVEEGEQHIEMDLGLGVLEEKDGNADSSSESGSEDAEEEGAEDGEPDLPVSSDAVDRSLKDTETRRMDTLTGRRRKEQNTGIKELG